MDYSIVICTFNRAANLSACIAHLASQQQTDEIDWEVLVVDNNSTDGTASIVEQLQGEHPSLRLRYVFEPDQGLSNARNRGIGETKGSHIIFIDDDIHVAPRWLRSYAQTFREHGCDAAGGPILVESPIPIPVWVRPEMMGFLGQLDYGPEPCGLDGVERFPFGGNMAFRRRSLERIGEFDPALGRKGSGDSAEELFKGEETEYFRRLASNGSTIRYTPGAEVEHHILPYQLQRRFFLTLHYNEGYQRALAARPQPGRTLLGMPLFIFPQTLRAMGEFLKTTLTDGLNGSMRQLMNVAYFLGRIRGYFDQGRDPTR